MCKKIVGDFEFKHHDGPGYYTFAPRFHQWQTNPSAAEKEKEGSLTEPYDVNNLPKDMSEWSKEFLRNCAKLGVKMAPTIHENWHIDGLDYNKTATFAALWGSYINPLPKGNMGNLLIRPGTHHVLADIHKKRGQCFQYDGKKEKPKPLPELKRENIADGRYYAVCVEAGDIIIAHPWLAHGIGVNMSKDIRLAVYCRMGSPSFYWDGR